MEPLQDFQCKLMKLNLRAPYVLVGSPQAYYAKCMQNSADFRDNHKDAFTDYYMRMSLPMCNILYYTYLVNTKIGFSAKNVN